MPRPAVSVHVRRWHEDQRLVRVTVSKSWWDNIAGQLARRVIAEWFMAAGHESEAELYSQALVDTATVIRGEELL